MKTNLTKEETLEVYTEIKLLTEFVKFVTNIEQSTDLDRSNGERIITCINSFDKPKEYEYFSISLDLYAYGVDTGCIWRTWSIYSESDFFTITAESHYAEGTEPEVEDYYFEYTIAFDVNRKIEKTYISQPISRFVEDVKQYKNYVTKDLNYIEIEIDLAD